MQKCISFSGSRVQDPGGAQEVILTCLLAHGTLAPCASLLGMGNLLKHPSNTFQETGTEVGFDSLMQQKTVQREGTQIIFLDHLEGILGADCPQERVLLLAFSGADALDNFLETTKSLQGRVILASTRHPASCGVKVFLGEVAPNGVQTIEAPQVSQHGVSVTYTSTDYGSVFEFANITVSAPFSAVAPKMPVELEQPEDQKSRKPRRLFLSSILKSTWRAVKSLASAALASSKLTAKVTFQLKISGGATELAMLEIKGTLANLLEVSGKKVAQLSEERQLIKFPRVPIKFMVGVVPVYLHVDAGLYAGVKASVEASYGLTAAADASLTLTATYRDSTGKVERSLNFNWDQLDTKATFDGKATAMLYLKPVVTFTAYKILQAAFVLKVFYQAIWTLEGEALAGECSANLKKFWGLDLSLTVKIRSIFTKSFNLYANQWPLAEREDDCGPFVSLPSNLLTSFVEGTSDDDDGSAVSDDASGDEGGSSSSPSTQTTQDGCRCKQNWTADWNGSEVSCDSYCCQFEGTSGFCVKEDPACGTECWGRCDTRRLTTCESVQPFCNANACEKEQPDCLRCGFCGQDDVNETGGSSGSSGASPPSAGSGSALSLASHRLGALWNGQIAPIADGTCPNNSSAELVLQLVEVNDWGGGNGQMTFMGATNVILPDGRCTVSLSYVADLYGGSIQGGTLKPSADDDFFGDCDGFVLPYGWRVDATTARMAGEDTMNCYSVDLQASVALPTSRRLSRALWIQSRQCTSPLQISALQVNVRHRLPTSGCSAVCFRCLLLNLLTL
ncbi:unnamed protein product [Symbiodinium necroappetens]|uniref:Uncharacterized protein n=1 Tax=Symbiodinium necroappetens TaxID=1628268 RepID=A0A812N6B9_9DINO|nr:unnamed protein product [Symbiodinium necroappetens]